jgi:protein-disulfide isomerase
VELGLDAERFTEDSDSGVVKDAVDDDYSSGTQARINSTPSFFVNGTQISGFNSLDDFRSAVLGSQHAN